MFYLKDGHKKLFRNVSNHIGEYTEYFTFVGTTDLIDYGPIVYCGCVKL